MKPIIIDMKSMSESIEVYESKPHPFFVIFIYFIIAIIVATIGWMYCFKIDIVVKGNGIFQQVDSSVLVTNKVEGTIEEIYIEDGAFVNEGDVLYKIDSTDIKKQISHYQSEQDRLEEKLLILNAYIKGLEGDISSFKALKDNSFYTEYEERREILQDSIDINLQSLDSQVVQWENSIKSVKESIAYYKQQQKDYNKALKCIKGRKNNISNKKTYLYTLLESYLLSYSTLKEQYDTQIEALKESKKNSQEKAIEAIESNMKDNYDSQIEKLKTEREQALSKLELEQSTSLQQQIEAINNTLLTLESDLAAKKVELQSIKEGETSLSNNTKVLSEKNIVYQEIQTVTNQKIENSTTLEALQKKVEECNVKAVQKGYISCQETILQGSYVGVGTKVYAIYPELPESYKAELYISNQDIGKLQIGQSVKFEIAAYPSSEYGVLFGKITSISKDIKVDQSSGSAYYLAIVEVDNTNKMNSKGECIQLMQGMACQGKVITDEKNILSYVLEKIDLLN